MDIIVEFLPNGDVERDVIEDAIESAFPERLEVTGGGTGEGGSNIDIEVLRGEAERYIKPLIKLLRGLGVPKGTWLNVASSRHEVWPTG